LSLENASPIVLAIFEESSISDLRHMISGLTNQSTIRFQICTEYHRDLSDDISFGELKKDIRHGNGILIFEIRDRLDDFYVHVKTLTNKNLIIGTLDSQSSVLDLKCRIRDKEGYGPDEQRLIFAGTQLQDGNSLAYYHIQKVSLKFYIQPKRMNKTRCPHH